jgi:hypothetical protein
MHQCAASSLSASWEEPEAEGVGMKNYRLADLVVQRHSFSVYVDNYTVKYYSG